MKQARKALMIIATLIIIATLFVACNPEEQTTPTDTKHTVSFVTNGGTSVASVTDTQISAEPVTTRNGYTFEGWFDNPNFDGVRISFPYTIASDATFYAKWEEIPPTEYTVTFVTNGGSSVDAITDTQIAKTPVTTKEGYTFDGWYDNADFKGSRIEFPYNLSKDMTLYAKWTEIPPTTYTATFVTNGGTTVNAIKGTQIKDEPQTTRNGYTFEGWYDNAQLSGNRIKFPYTLTKDTQFFAKWKEIPTTEFTVTFVTNGGSAVTPITLATIAQEPTTAKAGFTFMGWYDNPNFNGSRITFPYTVTQDKTFYAKWEEVQLPTYTVTYDSRGGSAVPQESNTQIVTEPVPTREGYTFYGWFDNAECSGDRIPFPYTLTSDITLYAKWERDAHAIEYTVTFETNGGSAVSPFTGTQIDEKPVPTKDGYNFVGWFESADFSTNEVLFPKTLTKNTVFYAKWELIPPVAHTVNFVTNGGTSVEPFTGTQIPSQPVTEREGYLFLGWFETSNFSGSKVAFPYDFDADTTLYAKWERKIYTASFETFDGTPVASVTDTMIAEEPTTSKEGYNFLGWYDNRACEGSRITFPYTISEDVVLYAKWERQILVIEYTVTFVTNGGSEVLSITGTKIDEEPQTTRSGYAFEGWYENASFDGNRVLFPKNLTENTVFYAKWRELPPPEYTVTFETNGGSEISSITTSKIDEEPVTEKDGHSFLGWFDNAELEGSRITFPYSVTSETILYAKWIAVGPQYVQTTLDDFDYTTDADGIITLNSYLGTATHLILPMDGEIAVGDECFNQGDDSTVTAIRIPANVTAFDAYGIYYALALKAFEVVDNHPTLSAVDGVLFSADKKTIVAYPYAKDGDSYEIPAGTLTIGDYAFYYKWQLAVSIPDSVEQLGNYCFGYCWGIHQLTIPNSVTTVGLNPYYKCDYLTDVTIPTTAIKNFSSLAALEYLEITGGTEVPFVGSKTLRTVKISSDEVTTIGMSAFSGCTALENVIFSDSITEIKMGAFSNCTALKTLTLPSNLQTLGGVVFNGCTALDYLEIPATITKMNAGEFNDISVTELYLHGIIHYTDDYGTEYDMNISDFKKLKTLHCPAEYIDKMYTGPYAYDYSSIENLILISGERIPSTTTNTTHTLGSLHTLVIPESVTSIDQNAFKDAYGLVQITNLSSVNWTPTCNGAPSTAEIRRSKDVEFEGTITREMNGFVKYIYKDEIRVLDCDDLTKTSLSEEDFAGYTTIGANAFASCDNLISIAIPSNITKIGDYAFCYSGDFQTVTLSKGLKEIGSHAFSSWDFSEVTIPESVEVIGSQAFTTEWMTINVKGHSEKPVGWADDWCPDYVGATINWGV